MIVPKVFKAMVARVATLMSVKPLAVLKMLLAEILQDHTPVHATLVSTVKIVMISMNVKLVITHVRVAATV